jgi:hypothetical protein
MTQALPEGWSRIQRCPATNVRRGWDWHVSGSGLTTDIARAVYGNTDEEFAASVDYEHALEQHRRRHVFYNKLPARRRSGGLSLPEAERSSRLITVEEFASVYAAADFSAEFGMPLDTMVTIVWPLLGYREPSEVQRAFTAFVKCASEWLRQRRVPVSFIYSHECGPELGLHTHVAIYVPAPLLGSAPTPGTISCRKQFRVWVMGYPKRNLGRRTPKALRVTFPRCETPWLHWRRFAYLVKGSASNETVMGRGNAPDGRPVKLGDLIAAPWCDPGPVAMNKRVGCSRSLDAGRRAIGVPTDFDLELPRTELPPDFTIEPNNVRRWEPWFRPTHLTRAPFRSKFEDGIRDIRRLYPREFWEPIIGPEMQSIARSATGGFP